MSDSRTSLLSKLWAVALSVLGIAIVLTWAVAMIQAIWPWLLGGAIVIAVLAVSATVLRRWWQSGRW